jgi:hypothetical protein
MTKRVLEQFMIIQLVENFPDIMELEGSSQSSQHFAITVSYY